MSVLSAGDVGAFGRAGVVILGGVLRDAEGATLVCGFNRNLADLSLLGMNATEPGKPGAFVEDFRNWQRIGEYEDVIRGSGLGRGAGELMGARPVPLFHTH